MNKKISIIVPVYNAEKYLNKCLDALINQSYKDIEVLCVNDGSKDNSLKILDEFANKDKKIKVFSQENSGPAKARNKGLENATGEYIMFCDADDYYEPDMCELMLNAMIENNVDIVMCDCNIVDHFNNNFRNNKELDYHYIKFKGYHKVNKDIIMNFNVLLWSKILKKSLINEYNIKFLDNFEHDDANFILKYLASSKSYYGLDKKLYNYQIINIDSVMGNFYLKKSKNKLDFVYSYNNLLQYLIDNNFNEDILESVIIYYVGTSLTLGLYLEEDDVIKLIEIQKDFFKKTNKFDYNWYVQKLKNEPLSECIKLYLIQLTKLEWIFSMKNRSVYEKVITIFGNQISIKRSKV